MVNLLRPLERENWGGGGSSAKGLVWAEIGLSFGTEEAREVVTGGVRMGIASKIEDTRIKRKIKEVEVGTTSVSLLIVLLNNIYF